MDMALHELPLAIFTTLAPLGAGAFVTLALVFFTKKFSAEEYKKIEITLFFSFPYSLLYFHYLLFWENQRVFTTCFL